MNSLAWAAEGARKDSERYRVCIAITHESHEGYGWCPVESFTLLHGPMAKAGLARIVDLVGTAYIAPEVAQAAMKAHGGGK